MLLISDASAKAINRSGGFCFGRNFCVQSDAVRQCRGRPVTSVLGRKELFRRLLDARVRFFGSFDRIEFARAVARLHSSRLLLLLLRSVAVVLCVQRRRGGRQTDWARKHVEPVRLAPKALQLYCGLCLRPDVRPAPTAVCASSSTLCFCVRLYARPLSMPVAQIVS